MTILDLCSGVGMLGLAVEITMALRLGVDVSPVAYCEIDDYARRVLTARMNDGSIKPAPSCTTSPGCPCPTCWGSWIASVRGSRASPSASPGSKPEARMSATSGRTSGPPLACYDLPSSSWRTSQASLLPGLGLGSGRWLGTLPASGTLLNGAVWDRETLERPTGAPDGGSLDTTQGNAWPTPTASQGGRNKSSSTGAAIRPNLGMAAKGWSAGTWPTPTARDGKDGACCLAQVESNGLLGRVSIRWRYTDGDLVTHAGQIHPPHQLRLSPLFAEWLMGWPLGWTDCEPLGMELIRWPLSLRIALSALGLASGDA